jgi:integral membrane sensor domain MASE1/nitrogen-specific signal transduction histidine kinase
MTQSRVFHSDSWPKAGAILIAFFSVHFVLVLLGNEFYFEPEHVTTLWPASGFFMTVLMVCRFRNWPVFILAAGLAQMSVDMLIYDRALLNATLFGINNTLEAVVGAYLLRRICSGPPDLEKLSDVLFLVTVGALASTLFTAMGGAGLVAIFIGISYWPVFQVWWFADILGVLVTAPIILAFLHTPKWPRNYSHKHYLELAVWLCGLVFVVQHIFIGNVLHTAFILDQPYIIFPFMIWAVIRFDARILSLALFSVSVLAVYFADSGYGYFVTPDKSVHEVVLILQAYLTTLVFFSWVLFAIFSQMRRLGKELDGHQHHLEELVDARTSQLTSAQQQAAAINVALKDSNALLDQFFIRAPVAMALVDTKMRFVKLNQQLADINGRSIKDHINKRPTEILPGPIGFAIEEEFESVIQTGQAIENEEISGETPGEPGVIRHFLHSYFPIFRADQSLMAIGVTLTDRTKTRQVEEQLRHSQKVEALGTLTGGIAHDFNNILYPIFINANLLLKRFDDDSEEFEFLSDIVDSAQRAKDIVSQILVFSHHRQDVRSINNLTPVIKEAVKLMRSAIPASITFKENFLLDEVSVFCDSSQIYQVLVNLGTNAGQAIEGIGTIDISLDIKHLDNLMCFEGTRIHGNYACLAVADNGVGISQDIISKIFDPSCATP